MICRICHSKETKNFTEINSKTYWECLTCFAKFLDSSHFLSEEEEHAHYCTHQNKVYDPDYRRFLSKLSIPLKRYLIAYSKGLDYGCGPGPALSVMLEEDGFEMHKYDPFFFPIKRYFYHNLSSLPVAKQPSIFIIQIMNLKHLIKCSNHQVSLAS